MKSWSRAALCLAIAGVIAAAAIFVVRYFGFGAAAAWGVVFLWFVAYAVVYWRTPLLEPDPLKKSWANLAVLAVILFLAGLAPNLVSAQLYLPRAAPPWRVVLIGEQASPHWASFLTGFKLAIRSHGVGELAGTDDRSYVGDYVIGRNDKAIRVRLENHAIPAEQRELQKFVSAVAADSNTLVMIGFVTSTNAHAALEAIEAKQPRIWPSVILPMATASKLVASHNSERNRPILRIVPPNSAQVQVIADEIKKSSKQPAGVSLAIFRDRSNYTYSADLAESLRKSVESKNVAVVFDGAIGPDGVGAYVTDSFVMLRPDYIVFLGMLDTGIPLVRQIRAMAATTKDWRPTVFLSDGSVDKEIMNYARRDQLVGIRGFFPHGRPRAHHVHNNVPETFDSPSYEMFGHDAAVFGHEILRAAVEKYSVLGRREVSDALFMVRGMCTRGESMIKEAVAGGEYHFDDFGDVVGFGYAAWEFNGERWVPTTAAP